MHSLVCEGKVVVGADLVALGKENGYEFTQLLSPAGKNYKNPTKD